MRSPGQKPDRFPVRPRFLRAVPQIPLRKLDLGVIRYPTQRVHATARVIRAAAAATEGRSQIPFSRIISPSLPPRNAPVVRGGPKFGIPLASVLWCVTVTPLKRPRGGYRNSITDLSTIVTPFPAVFGQVLPAVAASQHHPSLSTNQSGFHW